MRAGANGPIEGLIDLRKSPDARRMAALESPALPQVPACQVIIKSGQEPTEREPGSMISSPSHLVVHPLSCCGIWHDGDPGAARCAVPPSTAPDEGMLV